MDSPLYTSLRIDEQMALPPRIYCSDVIYTSSKRALPGRTFLYVYPSQHNYLRRTTPLQSPILYYTS